MTRYNLTKTALYIVLNLFRQYPCELLKYRVFGFHFPFAHGLGRIRQNPRKVRHNQTIDSIALKKSLVFKQDKCIKKRKKHILYKTTHFKTFTISWRQFLMCQFLTPFTLFFSYDTQSEIMLSGNYILRILNDFSFLLNSYPEFEGVFFRRIVGHILRGFWNSFFCLQKIKGKSNKGLVSKPWHFLGETEEISAHFWGRIKKNSL